MDPTTMILTALITGLASGLTSTAEKAVGELYTSFTTLLHKKVEGKRDAENALQAVEDKPESTARQAVLNEELEALDVQNDQQLVDLAKAILEHTDAEGSQSGKYNVRIYGGQGTTVGDRAHVRNTFEAPSKDA